jgi:hypothetical protein
MMFTLCAAETVAAAFWQKKDGARKVTPATTFNHEAVRKIGIRLRFSYIAQLSYHRTRLPNPGHFPNTADWERVERWAFSSGRARAPVNGRGILP